MQIRDRLIPIPTLKNSHFFLISKQLADYIIVLAGLQQHSQLLLLGVFEAVLPFSFEHRPQTLLVRVQGGYFLPDEVVVDLKRAETFLDEFKLDG
jgi:hypothetical protein